MHTAHCFSLIQLPLSLLSVLLWCIIFMCSVCILHTASPYCTLLLLAPVTAVSTLSFTLVYNFHVLCMHTAHCFSILHTASPCSSYRCLYSQFAATCFVGCFPHSYCVLSNAFYFSDFKHIWVAVLALIHIRMVLQKSSVLYL